MSDVFYAQLAAAFDRAAPDYDALYLNNPVMAWMRCESLAALRQCFPAGSRLLEIGCGTGGEAIELAGLGYRVLATDISPAMIGMARRKSERAGEARVTWRVLAAGDLQVLASEGDGCFDGAYASFGGLNCESRLDRVAVGLASLLRPGGRFVASVMNRWCAWEIAWGLAHLRFRAALRRLQPGWIQAGLATACGTLPVPSRYYSPRSFAREFTAGFQVERVRALPVALPPPFLAHLVNGRPTWFGRLEAIERAIRDRRPASCLGDHFLITLSRVDDRCSRL